MFALGTLALRNRLLLGTAQYPSPEIMRQAIQASGAEVVTVSVRRHRPGDRAGEDFWDLVRETGCHVLPNTAGCQSAKEAITTALMAREIFSTPRIKLEVIGDDYTLQPDPLGLVEAARELVSQGFEVLPYSTDDLVLARHLLEAGCSAVMPWAAPIGSGQGIRSPAALKTLREHLPKIPLIVDAGIGKPSEAARVMEMGYDAVLLNTAVALADNPVTMAMAFRDAIRAGRTGYEAGLMQARDLASPSTPTIGTPFWHQDKSSQP